MNVLVLSHMYPNQENEISGIFVQEQILALKKRGIQVVVLSSKPWLPDGFRSLLSRKGRNFDIPLDENRESIQVYYPRYLSFPRNFLLSTAGYRVFCGIKDQAVELHEKFNFDLIHAHAAIPDGFAAMLLARELDIPFVVTIHGLDFYQTLHRNQLLKKQVENVLGRSSAAVVVSDVLKRRGEKHLRENLPFHVVRNGINPENVLVRPGDTGHREGEKIVLSVSNLIERKGIQYVIHALGSLRNEIDNLKYIIVGDGPYRIHLERLIQELNLEQIVEFTGRKDHNKTMQYMAACDVFVLPSWDEAFGIVYIEAMALGKPVIGCKGEGIEDFVEDNVTGFLVKPKDIQSLIETIGNVLKNPEKIMEIGEKAQKHVLENFTWKKNAQEMIRIYEEIVNA